MKSELNLPIECGKHTCASKPTIFCRYFRTRRFGTEAVCAIFGDLDSVGGWTQRHAGCVAATAAIEDDHASLVPPVVARVKAKIKSVNPMEFLDTCDLGPDCELCAAPRQLGHVVEDSQDVIE
jgi:hypothetical protein